MNAEALPPQRVTLMQDDTGEDGPMPMHTDGMFLPDGYFTQADVELLDPVSRGFISQDTEQIALLAARLAALLPQREIDWNTDGSD
jgi:hypothetical protein